MIYYIYIIECTKNNKVYIGQTQSIKTRKNDHFGKLRRNEHHNPYLQEDYNKYGANSFRMIVLEQCESKEKALMQETKYIENYGGIECDSIYNCKDMYHNNNKMRENLKETAKNSKNYGMRGKHLSEQQKKYLSEIRTGSKSSKETCEKISKANKKYSDDFIEMLRDKYEELGSYEAVAKVFNLNRNVVSRLCRFGSSNCEKIYK